MTALDRTPPNINQLQPDGYQIIIKRLPTTVYFTQEITIPGFQCTPTVQPTPFVQIPIQGDHIIFEDLVFNFKVDEDMRNYVEIKNWMDGLYYPEDYSQYRDIVNKPVGEGLKSDISVLVTTNIKNPNIEILFRDAFPTALSGFKLHSTNGQSMDRVTSTVTFRYLKYDISVLPT